MIHPIMVPGLEIPGNVMLAPMAGYTDAAFRQICLEQGACFAFTEMVSAEACYFKNLKTLKLLEKTGLETGYGVQIFTSDPGMAAAAVKAITCYRPSIIDLNCGCSIPKILKNGSGAALLKEPRKIKTIITAMRNQTDIPISIKIRSGWDADSINFHEVARQAIAAGIAMLTLHPRTRSQVFSGTARWEQIRELKNAFSAVPVIGSGDLFTAADVKKMFEQTGCDGVMVARGALGNPFIFRQIKQLLAGDPEIPGAAPEEVLQVGLKQLRIAISFKGEKRACTEMRKQFCAYTKGLPGSAWLRKNIVLASSYAEYERLINLYLAEMITSFPGHEPFL